jgi:hypothetical protein
MGFKAAENDLVNIDVLAELSEGAVSEHAEGVFWQRRVGK